MTDPTGSGVSIPDSGIAQLSCSEVGALCLKAARGAGLSWGLAEEAGYAARWLYARGLDGPGALLEVLDKAENCGAAVLSDGSIRPKAHPALSPITVGTALSDFAGLRPGPISAKPVLRPLLVLPFLHQMACAAQEARLLKWAQGSVTVDPVGAFCGEAAFLEKLDVAEIVVSAAPDLPESVTSIADPSPLQPEILKRLDDYAMRTTVPATAASRADAGSTDGDND